MSRIVPMRATPALWHRTAEIKQLELPGTRRIVAGVPLALDGVLLIIATHRGQFG